MSIESPGSLMGYQLILDAQVWKIESEKQI